MEEGIPARYQRHLNRTSLDPADRLLSMLDQLAPFRG